MSNRGHSEIADALTGFLDRGGVKQVHLAGGSLPPPQMAYLVHFPRLSIILEGREQMEIESAGHVTTVSLGPGHALFVPPNCWNKPAWTGGVRVLTVLFGKRQTGMSLVSQDHGGEPATASKAHFHRPIDGPGPGILQALGSLSDSNCPEPTASLLVEALLHSCLSLLSEPEGQRGSKAEKTFQNICLYLQENFQFPLTRDSVADYFHLSPNHVSRLFRTTGLMRFNDYLTSVRLDRAKFLLRNHDSTLSEVARSCGFSDTAYFCRVFKRRTRITPTDYRMQGRA